MERREFTKSIGLSAIAVSAFGFIQCTGRGSYIGDCQTTTDILGPFYRPGSPERNNLVVEGMPGDIVVLSGVIRQKDCITPVENAMIELWHCSADEIYDNETSEFRYRGTSYSDRDGNYSFTTQMPVPYDAGGGEIRPAHFHIRVSTNGYPDLVTQLYFTGDPNISKDFFSSIPAAQSRILEVGEDNGVRTVLFDCNLSDKVSPSSEALDKLVGTYQGEDSELVLFADNGELWVANEVYGEVYDYTNANEFNYRSMPDGLYDRLQFEFTNDKIKLTRTTNWGFGETVAEYRKTNA